MCRRINARPFRTAVYRTNAIDKTKQLSRGYVCINKPPLPLLEKTEKTALIFIRLRGLLLRLLLFGRRRRLLLLGVLNELLQSLVLIRLSRLRCSGGLLFRNGERARRGAQAPVDLAIGAVALDSPLVGLAE